jgi:hypothetical protein
VANESVANYPVTQVDSSKYSFTTASLAGQYGGWLANGTSGDSIAVSVPFWVAIGDSQAEGHPARHGRLHPLGVAGFSYNYIDSVGTLTYHLTSLTKFPWINHGIGGQTSEQVLWRYDRDALGLTSTPTGGADSRGTKTLNRKPIGILIIVGANDVFTAGFNPQRTKANILAMCQKSAQFGQYIIVLTVPGNANILTSTQDKYVEEVNGWLKSGALNRYGAIIVDYNSWWKDPAWKDNAHPNPAYIVDQVHPSVVGYDSLANYIFRKAKLPVLQTVVVDNRIAPTGGITGFSRPNSVNISGTTYSFTNPTDSAIVSAPFRRDSVWFKINSSTNVNGTTYSGFSDIRWILRNNSSGLYQKPRNSGQIGYLEIQGSSQSANNNNFVARDQYGNILFRIRDDGSVYSNGRSFQSTNTVFGQSTFQSWTSGTSNTGFGSFVFFGLTSGSNNSMFGQRAGLTLTTGTSNSGFGNTALTLLTTGSNNSAFGNGSLAALTTGGGNTGYGANTLTTVTTTSDNTAMGVSALITTTGADHTAIGRNALFNTTTGTQSTAIGKGAGQEITTSALFTAVGFNAGRYLSDGFTSLQTSSNSLYLGASTKGTNSSTNENVIGYNAIGNGSNTLTLGAAAITDLFTGAEIFTFGNGIKIYTGSGSPESVVTAPVGSMFLRSDGGAATSFYIKESGSGNTGWVAK